MFIFSQFWTNEALNYHGWSIMLENQRTLKIELLFFPSTPITPYFINVSADLRDLLCSSAPCKGLGGCPLKHRGQEVFFFFNFIMKDPLSWSRSFCLKKLSLSHHSSEKDIDLKQQLKTQKNLRYTNAWSAQSDVRVFWEPNGAPSLGVTWLAGLWYN